MPAASTVLDPLLDRLFVRGQVVALEPVTPRMRRVRLGGPAVAGLDWTPGQHVRVHVTDLRRPQAWVRLMRDVLRTYSIWAYDGTTLDLCVLDHGDGPGARWARALSVGDEVLFGRPEGRLVAGPGPYHVFAGEETAAVAFGAILRALPADARVHGVIEVPSEHDRMPLPRDAELTWSYRGHRPAADSASLVAAVRDLPLPAHAGVAYVAGEARTCQAVRAHLVRDRGWPRRAVIVKPFWAPGRRGMD